MSDTNELVERLTGFANGTFQYRAYRGKAPEGVPQLRSDILALVAALSPVEAVPVVKPTHQADALEIAQRWAIWIADNIEGEDDEYGSLRSSFERDKATLFAALAHPPAQAGAVPVAWALMSKTAGVLSVTVERAVADKWSAQSTLSDFPVAPLFLTHPPAQAGVVTEAEIQRLTNEIARKHGCDRGTFAVCWGKVEKGLPCRCEDEARAALGAQTPPEGAVTEAYEAAAREADHTAELYARAAEASKFAVDKVGFKDRAFGAETAARNIRAKARMAADARLAEVDVIRRKLVEAGWLPTPPVNQSEGADRG